MSKLTEGDKVVFRDRTAVVDEIDGRYVIIRCRSAGITTGSYLPFQYRVPKRQLRRLDGVQNV